MLQNMSLFKKPDCEDKNEDEHIGPKSKVYNISDKKWCYTL